MGLASPAAAAIIAATVWVWFDSAPTGVWAAGIAVLTAFTGLLMVSNFRYRSFKDLDLKHRMPFKYLVVGVFIFALVAIRPEVMLFVLFLSYAVLGAVFGVFLKQKLLLSNSI